LKTWLRLGDGGQRFAPLVGEGAGLYSPLTNALPPIPLLQPDLQPLNKPRSAQASWDYFYATNRLLDSRQKAVDQRRAEALGRVLPLADRHNAVKVNLLLFFITLTPRVE